jgi:hypothetical protein
MTKLIITLLFGLAGSFLGYKLIKKSKNEQNTLLKLVGFITLMSSTFGCIIILSFLKLKGTEWSDDNKELFGLISILSISVPILLIGLKLLLKGRKEKVNLLLITGSTWIIITLLCSYLSIQYIQNANSGWTKESRLFYLEKCEALSNEGKNYKCNCYVEELMKKYASPEEYQKSMSDESTGEKEKLESEMNSLCPCGKADYSEDEIEEIPDF